MAAVFASLPPDLDAMRTLPFLLLIAGPWQRCAAQKLNIWLSTNDCVNCMSALTVQGQLDPAIQVKLYADVATVDYLPALLEELGVHQSDRLSLTYLPSRDFRANVPHGSRCSFTSSFCSSFEFALVDLPLMVPRVSCCARSYTNARSSEIVDTLVLSDDFDMYVFRDLLVISDPLLARSYELDLGKGDAITPVRTRFQKDAVLRSIAINGLDTAGYDSIQSRVRAMGSPAYRSTSWNCLRDTVFVLGPLYWRSPEFSDKQHIAIQMFPTLSIHSSDGDLIPWKPWTYWMPDTLERYLVTIYSGLYFRDDEVFAPLVAKDPGHRPDHLLCAFRLGSNGYEFDRMLPITTPVQIKRSGLWNANVTAQISGGLYWIGSYPFFYDLESGQQWDLGDILKRSLKGPLFSNGSSKYWTYSALLFGDHDLLLLCRFAGEPHLLLVDLKERNVIRNSLIEGRDFHPDAVRLTPKGDIIGLRKDRTGVLLLQ